MDIIHKQFEHHPELRQYKQLTPEELKELNDAYSGMINTPIMLLCQEDFDTGTTYPQRHYNRVINTLKEKYHLKDGMGLNLSDGKIIK